MRLTSVTVIWKLKSYSTRARQRCHKGRVANYCVDSSPELQNSQILTLDFPRIPASHAAYPWLQVRTRKSALMAKAAPATPCDGKRSGEILGSSIFHISLWLAYSNKSEAPLLSCLCPKKEGAQSCILSCNPYNGRDSTLPLPHLLPWITSVTASVAFWFWKLKVAFSSWLPRAIWIAAVKLTSLDNFTLLLGKGRSSHRDP